MTNAGHQMIITLYALSKGAGTGRKRAEMWQVIKDEELSNYKSKGKGRLHSGFIHRYTEIPITTRNNDFQCSNVCDLGSH
jgi:hypothetical protein